MTFRKLRKEPSLFKRKKTISISTWLWNRIEIYGTKCKLKRSQVIERGMMMFLAKEINDTIAELNATKIKVAMLEQQIRNAGENKELLKEQ